MTFGEFIQPDSVTEEESKARKNELKRFYDAKEKLLDIALFVLVTYKPNLEKKLLKV